MTISLLTDLAQGKKDIAEADLGHFGHDGGVIQLVDLDDTLLIDRFPSVKYEMTTGRPEFLESAAKVVLGEESAALSSKQVGLLQSHQTRVLFFASFRVTDR